MLPRDYTMVSFDSTEISPGLAQILLTTPTPFSLSLRRTQQTSVTVNSLLAKAVALEKSNITSWCLQLEKKKKKSFLSRKKWNALKRRASTCWNPIRRIQSKTELQEGKHQVNKEAFKKEETQLWIGCWERIGDPHQPETDVIGWKGTGEGCPWEAGCSSISAAAAGLSQGSQAWTSF